MQKRQTDVGIEMERERHGDVEGAADVEGVESAWEDFVGRAEVVVDVQELYVHYVALNAVDGDLGKIMSVDHEVVLRKMMGTSANRVESSWDDEI